MAPDADFSNVKTYTLLPWQEDANAMINEIEKQRLRDAFTAEFDVRNLTEVPEDGDIDVVIFLVVDEKTAINAYTNYYGGYGGRYYRGGWGWGGGTTTYTQEDYQVGTIVLDVFDGESEKLMWQSVSSGTVKDNPQKRAQNMPTVARKAMNDFPITRPK